MTSMTHGPLPNFLLVGMSKAGTTTIHDLLARHPQVFMSRMKEPGYFSFLRSTGHRQAVPRAAVCRHPG